MVTSIARLSCLGLLLVLGAGCSTGSIANPQSTACDGDEMRCMDGSVETCRQGFWVTIGPCPLGTACQAGQCADVCTPLCDGRTCGPDGCGGQCGACDAGVSACNATGVCVPLPAGCGNTTCDADEDCALCPVDCGICCGNNICDQTNGENCATCASDCLCGAEFECNVARGMCAEICFPSCENRLCGSDGCGGTCGACFAPQLCAENGVCVDPPQSCGNSTCDTDQGEDCATCALDCGECCGDGVCSPSQNETCQSCTDDCICADDEVCNFDSRVCECVPVCDGVSCDDGCGGACAVCQRYFVDMSERVATPIERDTTDVRLFDADGDGDLDIIWASQPGEEGTNLEGLVELSRNNGDGTFVTSEIGDGTLENWTFVLPVDIDSDGDDDLVLTRPARTDDGLALMISDGTGNFTRDMTIPAVTGATHGLIFGRATAADIDDNGYNDIIIPIGFVLDLSQDAPNVVLLNTAGTFTESPDVLPAIPSDSDYTFCVVADDLTGDGAPDIFVGEGERQQRIMVNDGVGMFTDETFDDGTGTARMPTDRIRGYDCMTSDLDRDGDMDLVVISDLEGPEGASVPVDNYLFVNDGSGHFTSQLLPTLTGPHDTRGVAVGDVDGDGNLDVVLGNLNETVPHNGSSLEILLGDGALGFTPTEEWPSFGGVFGVAVGDLNADGADDIVIAVGGPDPSGSQANRLLLSQ